MNKLLEKHPDLDALLRCNPETKVYKILTKSGNIKEYWEKDEEGNWTEQTEREKIREQIEIEKEQLEALKRAEARKRLKDKIQAELMEEEEEGYEQS